MKRLPLHNLFLEFAKTPGRMDPTDITMDQCKKHFVSSIKIYNYRSID